MRFTLGVVLVCCRFVLWSEFWFCVGITIVLRPSSDSWEVVDLSSPCFFSNVNVLLILQTGPKGVIKDYQRFKQLEREKSEEKKQELAALTKKLALTCRTDVSNPFAIAARRVLSLTV